MTRENTRSSSVPGPSHTGRRASITQNAPWHLAESASRALWFVHSSHFVSTFSDLRSLTRNMISVRTLDLADPLCRWGETGDRETLLYRYYRAHEGPHYSMLPKYARGAVLFAGFITIFLDTLLVETHTCLWLCKIVGNDHMGFTRMF